MLYLDEGGWAEKRRGRLFFVKNPSGDREDVLQGVMLSGEMLVVAEPSLVEDRLRRFWVLPRCSVDSSVRCESLALSHSVVLDREPMVRLRRRVLVLIEFLPCLWWVGRVLPLFWYPGYLPPPVRNVWTLGIPVPMGTSVVDHIGDDAPAFWDG
ncbi:unnamed protein product [Trypanosoma congolense IL3000]|uniref:WGS project CAEQ00000000 data, annotated contig 296 n=1 Tax=Trypanosoma congolense (strain IL3000) TaxID=1068625 RepID=F9WEP1_TRYCI|nr:unnamed protein product [Trypanosoma congolense IL3000]